MRRVCALTLVHERLNDMNNPKKFPIGVALYWVSLALCALVFIADDFSFAGGGVSGVYTTTPCIVTNTECPLCDTFTSGETYLAIYNMAGMLHFTYPEFGVGRYQLDEVMDVVCFKSALCEEKWRDENYECTIYGCVQSTKKTGCVRLAQSDWVTFNEPYQIWKKGVEE